LDRSYSAGSEDGEMASRTGAGEAARRRSAEPEAEVEARLPCLARRRRGAQRREAVVLTLKVLWLSPPVPTMSHCQASALRRRTRLM
jgi:hypothetical protein